MVRISIPTLPDRPPAPPSALTRAPLAAQAAHLARFLAAGAGRTLAITGAGVSVESGIRAYRGKEGSYSNPNYKPIFYGELVDDSPRGEMYRKRYWARSFLGYPPVRDAQPNPTHIYLASLQALGIAPWLITQNVDNLHRKALARVLAAQGRSAAPADLEPLVPDALAHASAPLQHGAAAAALTHAHGTGRVYPPAPRVHELHGTLARVHCLQHLHEQTRDSWQAQLSAVNPAWEAEAVDMAENGRLPRTNPDGDVELPGADYTTFSVPECSLCVAEGKKSICVHRDGQGPLGRALTSLNVIFFGETLPVHVKDESFDLIGSASRVLVLGTSLATYSAFRLIKAAREQGKPVLLISQGPTRADDTEGVEKMDVPAGPVLRAFLDEYLSGADVDGVRAVLDSGIVKSLPSAELPRDDGMIPSAAAAKRK